MSTLSEIRIFHKRFITGDTVKLQHPYAPLDEQIQDGLYEFDLASTITDMAENAPPNAYYLPYLWTYKYADSPQTYFKVIDMNSQTPLCVSAEKGDVTATCWYLHVVPGPFTGYWISAYGFSEASGNTFAEVIKEVVPAKALQNGSVCVNDSGALISFKNKIDGESFTCWDGLNENWTHQGNDLLAEAKAGGLVIVFYGNVRKGDDEGDNGLRIPHFYAEERTWVHPLDIVSDEIERMERLNTIIHWLTEKGMWPPNPKGTQRGTQITVSRKVSASFNRKADKIIANLRKTADKIIRDINKAKSILNNSGR